MSLALTPVAVIGIAVGASVGVLLCGITILVVAFEWRQRRLQKRHADIEKSRSTTRAALSATETCQPNIVGRRSGLSPKTAWTGLSSTNDLAYVPRLSSSTSPPPFPLLNTGRPKSRLSKAKPSFRRSFRLKTIRASKLSDIPESPKQRAKSPGIQSIIITRTGSSLIQNSSNAETREEEPGKQEQHGATPPGSPRPNVEPRLALKPEPLFTQRLSNRKSAFMDAGTASVTDRSRSVPSMLGPSKDDPFSTQNPDRSSWSRQHSRSISLRNQTSGNVPQQPPPPLPAKLTIAQQRPQAMSRNESATSMSSMATTNSSILQRDVASPSIRARTEFTQRNPDTKLGAHLRQGSADINDLFGSKRSVSPRRSRKRSRVQKSNTSSARRMYPRPIPMFEVPIHAPLERSRSTGALPIDGGIAIASSAQAEVHAEAPARSIPKNVCDPEVKADVVGHLAKRRSVVSVSEDGSPGERHRAAPLRTISGNLLGPAREDSQSSADTVGNPFYFDPSYVPAKDAVKPSALKGSPNAKKRHNRQKCVRISIQPTHFGPSSRSSSLYKLDEVVKEDNNGRASSVRGHWGAARDISHPDDNGSTQSSPTLSLSRTHRDKIISRRPEFRLSTHSASRNRESTASSTMTLSAFPTPGEGFVFPFLHETKNKPSYSAMQQDMHEDFIPPALTLYGRERSPFDRVKSKEPKPTSMLPCQTTAGQEYDPASPYFEPTATKFYPSEKDRASLTPAPLRSLSPPPKSSPTIHVSTPTPIRTRTTPLWSTVNPLNTKPDLVPPYSAFKPAIPSPSGPRSAPPQAVLRSVRSLRQMDSEKFDMLQNEDASREEWRFMHIGREASPTLGSSPNDARSSPLLNELHDEDEQDSGKENRPRGGKVGSVWDDGADFWPTYVPPEPTVWKDGRNTLTPQSRKGSKGPGTGNARLSRNSGSSTTPASLYDRDGFYIERSPQY